MVSRVKDAESSASRDRAAAGSDPVLTRGAARMDATSSGRMMCWKTT